MEHNTNTSTTPRRSFLRNLSFFGAASVPAAWFARNAHGADGVYIRNHGGRQLDQSEGTLDVLPEVVRARWALAGRWVTRLPPAAKRACSACWSCSRWRRAPPWA